tara:strand:- start:1726 stop:2250 length:525 start_codon:yes stop_codon:yes gene_type:complete
MIDQDLFPLPTKSSIDKVIAEYEDGGDQWFNQKMKDVGERNIQVPRYIRHIARAGANNNAKHNAHFQGLWIYLLFERGYQNNLKQTPVIEKELAFPGGWEGLKQGFRNVVYWDTDARHYDTYLAGRSMKMWNAIFNSPGQKGEPPDKLFGTYAASRMHELISKQLEKDQKGTNS